MHTQRKMMAIKGTVAKYLLLMAAVVLPTLAVAQCGTGGVCTDVQLLNWWNVHPGPEWKCWTPPECDFWFGCYCCSRPKFSAAGQCSCPNCCKETGLGCAEGCAGAPINLANGNTYIEQTDLRVPGLGGGLTLTRTWNSMWPSSQSGVQSGLFGLNWRSNYEERVFWGSDGLLKYARGDGSFWSFGYDAASTSWRTVAPANGELTLTSGDTYWTLIAKNGEKRQFDNANGSLTSIIDRNGNMTQLSHDGVNRLLTVTDPAGRHLYFGYNGSSYLVNSITTDFGINLSYSYDAQGRLTLVTNADTTTVSFEYNEQSLITAVKDSAGKILESHTYDMRGRGLTSSRANGVELITVSYPQ